ncbi:hypothetical protein F4779DRAFT_623371 [Xylariaceae sp. FL0662B]|nr:hypothetical protein F4779DRAFT_623371 [Xylariaceae sp. FL0662B]
MYSTSCPELELSKGHLCCVHNAPLRLQLLELAELAPALFCSCVTTSYIVQEESGSSPLLTRDIIRLIRVEFLTHISPGLALGSCLVLGCCLSSYTHRRRCQDQYQIIVFVTWIAWAICVGWGIGASADMVTLGIVPWALCAAMPSSFATHLALLWPEKRERCDRHTVDGVVDSKKGIA